MSNVRTVNFGSRFSSQEFERHTSVQLRIASRPDCTHAAAAQHFQQDEALKTLIGRDNIGTRWAWLGVK